MRNISDAICEYINERWIGTSKDSLRAFALDHDIDEKTVRQINNSKEKPHNISLNTLEKICKARGITLHQFFKLIGR